MSLDHTLTRLGRRAIPRPRLRRLRIGRLLAAAVAAVALLVGGYLLLRDSALVRVERVQVTGVDSSAEPRIDAALESAARGMTTLHVHEDALERAVAGFPSVAGLQVSTDLPHGMTIRVLERRPVAALVAGTSRLAVSADGRLLRDVQDTIGLPAIAQGTLPAGDELEGARPRAALAVASAAPHGLLRRAQRIAFGPKGLTVQLAGGPPLVFGTAEQAAAKWAGAARVLADPSAAGATYLDLREPGRVAAGGLGPVQEEDAEGDAEQPVAGASATPPATATPVPAATPTPVPTGAATPVPTATTAPTP